MGRYINPFTDWGFKYIFGRKLSKDLLIDFLNCLFINERHIVDLQFLDKEQSPEFKEERGIIYDIYCLTDTGEYIIVEMQNRAQRYFKERALFYLSKSIISQGEKGNDWDYNIKAVYGVFFINFTLSPSLKDFRTDVILADRDSGQQFSDKMRMTFLELPKFTKTQEECKNDFERWIFILKHMEALEKLPFTSQKKLFHKLEEMAKIARINKKDREIYEESLKVYRDNKATYEWAVDSGFEKGRTAGRAQGRAEGKAEGKAEGRIEEKKEIAMKMWQAGMTVNQIIQMTGLSEQDIKNLQSSHKD